MSKSANVGVMRVVSASEYARLTIDTIINASYNKVYYVETKDGEANVPQKEGDYTIKCESNEDIRKLRIHTRAFRIDIESCENLEEVNVDDPTSVVEAVFDDCPALRIVPRTMTNMKHLGVGACDEIESLPYSDHLKTLVYHRGNEGKIDVPPYPGNDIELVFNLPSTIYDRDRINYANLYDFMPIAARVSKMEMVRSCTKIVKNVFPALSIATFIDCPNLETFEAFSQNLKKLSFNDCPELRKLSSEIKSNMDTMAVARCPKLMGIDMPDNLHRVREFNMDSVVIPKESLEERYNKLKKLTLLTWHFESMKKIGAAKFSEDVVRLIIETIGPIKSLEQLRKEEIDKIVRNPFQRSDGVRRLMNPEAPSMLEDDM